MKANLKLLTVAALLSVGTVAVAQDDSSANAAGGYADAVVASEGVVLRVPVDANGFENKAAAELRVTGAVDSATSAVEAFEAGTAVAKDALFDVSSDSSTGRGGYYGGYNNYGCGWNSYNNYGYNSHYGNYNYYQPTYTYNYTNTWSYTYSQTYTYYSYGQNYNYYTYQPSHRYCGNSYSSWGHRWY